MHLANELLSPTVALGGLLAGGGAVACASAALRDKLDSRQVPLMGVLGAFVFAAQMINFTLPMMPGTSDHLIGTVLLAILLGPHAAVLAVAGILVVQCLIFQDGGLLALGCNVINMAVVPAYLGYGVYRLAVGRSGELHAGKVYPAAFGAGFCAVVAGAVLVCVEVGVSDRLAIPMRHFSLAMVTVHLISGTIEGVMTAVILALLYKFRPDLSGRQDGGDWSGGWQLSIRAMMVTILSVALLTGAVVSWLASPYADGLEWAVYEKQYGVAEPVKLPGQMVQNVDDFQTRYALMPDYEKPTGASGDRSSGQELDQQEGAWSQVGAWRSIAGISGTLVTLALIYLVGRVLGRPRSIKEPISDASSVH